MAKTYRKKLEFAEAVRYGSDEDGSWFLGAVEQVARFMLRVDDNMDLSISEMFSVVRPAAGRRPWAPEDGVADLEILDTQTSNMWMPLSLGDYILQDQNGGFYPVSSDQFQEVYDEYAQAPETDIPEAKTALGTVEVYAPGADANAREVVGVADLYEDTALVTINHSTDIPELIAAQQVTGISIEYPTDAKSKLKKNKKETK